jgi:hypothetical protein
MKDIGDLLLMSWKPNLKLVKKLVAIFAVVEEQDQQKNQLLVIPIEVNHDGKNEKMVFEIGGK